MAKPYKLTLFLVLALALTGCTAVPAPVMGKPDDSILKAFEKTTAGLNNRFGLELYAQLLEENENLLMSPVSVGLALAMAYNGADGETREAMAKVLKAQGIDLEELNKNNLALLYFLRTADEKVQLNIANSLWKRQGFPFAGEFVGRVQEFYLAAARELDFNDPKAADTINRWVKESTEGLIPEIVEDPIDPLTIMFLINAVYFQGEWTQKFEKELTSEQTFYTAAGGEVKVPMMYQSGRYDYYRNDYFQAVRLPYGQEGRMAMYVFLPHEDVGLQGFHAGLTEGLEGWLGKFTEGEGTILLPRFTLEYEKSLKEPLKALGMGRAFDPARAEFAKMVPEESRDDIYISDVKHKAFIQVDEAGTEAAAVTSVEVRVTSMPMYDFQMEVNRPFFYVIHDRETETILFMGCVQDLT